MEQEPRPPNVDARSNRGEPMSSGAVVRIDDRNGAEALRLLHEAYYALGRGFYDRPEGQYGATYNAIAEFLYPDVIDVETPAIETLTFVLPGVAHCAECGTVVTEHVAIVAHDARAGIGIVMRPVVKPGTNRPCGHQAQYVVIPESPAIDA